MSNPPDRAAYLEGRVVYLRLHIQRSRAALEGYERALGAVLHELEGLRYTGEPDPERELRMAMHLVKLRERLAWKAPAIPNQGGRP